MLEKGSQDFNAKLLNKSQIMEMRKPETGQKYLIRHQCQAPSIISKILSTINFPSTKFLKLN